MKAGDNNDSSLTYFLEYSMTLSPSRRFGPPAHRASNVAVVLEVQLLTKSLL